MKQPGVKALTFDVGGTVFDWRGTIEEELQTLSAEKGVDVDVRQHQKDLVLARPRIGSDRGNKGPIVNALLP